MMQDFAATQKVLIINRLRSPSSDIGKFSQQAVQSYGHNTKFLLQAAMPIQVNLDLQWPV